MLTFEQKKEIIESFPQLTKKEISMKRLNYHFEESLYDKKIVVQHLHPNGNGFVYVGDLLKYKADDRGLVNIREATEQELREIIEDSITYLSEEGEEEEPLEQVWTNREGQSLTLLQEDPFWNIYHGYNLEESFGTYDDAEEYLLAERFRPTTK